MSESDRNAPKLTPTSPNVAERKWERRKAFLSAEHSEPTLNTTERIVALPNGVVVESFKKGFSTLLEECRFIYTDADDRHSLTSLRHSYATFALTRTFGKRPTISILAGQMGTSIKMIEQLSIPE